MRAAAAVLALLTVLAVAAPAALAATDRPEAQMLLDLDLLREADPRAHREMRVARSVRLLEFLKRLHTPGAAGPNGHGRRGPREAC
jgi:hypothetical protein